MINSIGELYSFTTAIMNKYPSDHFIMTGDFNLPDIDWDLRQVNHGTRNKTMH